MSSDLLALSVGRGGDSPVLLGAVKERLRGLGFGTGLAVAPRFIAAGIVGKRENEGDLETEEDAEWSLRATLAISYAFWTSVEIEAGWAGLLSFLIDSGFGASSSRLACLRANSGTWTDVCGLDERTSPNITL